MPISAKVSGTWRTATGPAVRVGGTWRPLAAAFVRVSGTWRQVFTAVGPLIASLDQSSLTGSGTGDGPFNTGNVNVSVSGGVTPYVFLWEYVSGDGFGNVHPNDGNLASVYFIGNATAPTTKSAVWRCKVTDNVGTIAYTGNVTASFTFISGTPSVNLSGTSATGSGAAPGAAVSNTITGTASGGTPGYTYLWSRLSGDTSTSATNSTGATTTFLHSGGSPGVFSSTWKLTVTDSLGAHVDSATVNVSLTLS